MKIVSQLIRVLFGLFLINLTKNMGRVGADGITQSDQKKISQFRLLDEDSNGYLDPEEIRNGFSDWSEREITEFFNKLDTNNDGVISLDEFKNSSIEE
jgi:Ca2+-binding EF-hand superfamily protein